MKKKKIEEQTEVRASGSDALRGVGPRTLGIASFVCGACVMILELAGSREASPYMGTSQIVWTSLIGIIMASLTLGYWLGGRVADRRPDVRVLACVIAAAAAYTLFVGLFSDAMLGALSSSIRNIYVASMIGSVAMFTVPSVLLGMVSPFIVRLALTDVEGSGRTVGRYSALSNAGSIVGTFLSGFVLISFIASNTIILIVAAALAIVALMLGAKSMRRGLIPIFALASGLGILNEAGVLGLDGDDLVIDTKYNTVRVSDTKLWTSSRTVRLLQTDPLGSQSVMYLDAPDELYSDYTKFYDLAFHFRPETKRVLMMGGGGYCVPKHITATRPEVEVDVVELDPGITQIARDHFFLTDRPGQRIFHEDARLFVNRESAEGTNRYDAIFEDVFGSSYSIPFHLTTTECMKGVSDLLADGGVLVINIIAELNSELFAGIYSSIADHFKTVMIFPATFPNSAGQRQNIMIAAIKGDEPIRAAEDPMIARLLAHRWTAPYTPKVAAFTDKFAPVERYSLRSATRR